MLGGMRGWGSLGGGEEGWGWCGEVGWKESSVRVLLGGEGVS